MPSQFWEQILRGRRWGASGNHQFLAGTSVATANSASAATGRPGQYTLTYTGTVAE